MPIFLDVHSIETTTEEDLIEAQSAPRDELGVKVVNILYKSRSWRNLLFARCAK